LIFDEATSALDVTSERIVQAALAKASQGRTTITIAHRLSTIKAADQIVVVAEGRVVQQGTHADLLQDVGGAYWKLVNSQQLVASVAAPLEEMSSRGGDDTLENKVYSAKVKESEPAAMSCHELSEKSTKLHVDNCGSTEAKLCDPKVEAQPLNKGFFSSFAMLLFEQKRNWAAYAVLLIGAAGAGCKFRKSVKPEHH